MWDLGEVLLLITLVELNVSLSKNKMETCEFSGGPDNGHVDKTPHDISVAYIVPRMRNV